MKSRVVLVSLFVILSVCLIDCSRAGGGDWNTTIIRNKPSMNISSAGPGGGSFFEGDYMNFSITAYCFNASCGRTTLRLLYCVGSDCPELEEIDDDSTDPVYTNGDIFHVCRLMEPGDKCSGEWSVRARKVDDYSIVMFAEAEEFTRRLLTDRYVIRLSGCGDGECNFNETFDRCPEDCCESDCTATYDETCHKRCGGYNNCSFALLCDGKRKDYGFCPLPNSYTVCCSVEQTTCEFREYCLKGKCIDCSTECDGLCQARSCQGVDPDCDVWGNATMPCCGNNRIEESEECDANLTGSCDLGCTRECRCVVPTTTTTRFTSTTRRTLPTIASTTSTTIEYVNMTDYIRDIAKNSSDETENSANSAGDDDWLTSPEMTVVFIGLVLLFFIFLVFAVLALFLRRFLKKRQVLKRLEKLKSRKKEIKDSMADVMLDYSERTRGIEDTSRTLYEYEKELTEIELELERINAHVKKK